MNGSSGKVRAAVVLLGLTGAFALIGSTAGPGLAGASGGGAATPSVAMSGLDNPRGLASS